jgi:hypothetical protein
MKSPLLVFALLACTPSAHAFAPNDACLDVVAKGSVSFAQTPPQFSTGETVDTGCKAVGAPAILYPEDRAWGLVKQNLDCENGRQLLVTLRIQDQGEGNCAVSEIGNLTVLGQ